MDKRATLNRVRAHSRVRAHARPRTHEGYSLSPRKTTLFLAGLGTWSSTHRELCVASRPAVRIASRPALRTRLPSAVCASLPSRAFYDRSLPGTSAEGQDVLLVSKGNSPPRGERLGWFGSPCVGGHRLYVCMCMYASPPFREQTKAGRTHCAHCFVLYSMHVFPLGNDTMSVTDN